MSTIVDGFSSYEPGVIIEWLYDGKEHSINSGSGPINLSSPHQITVQGAVEPFLIKAPRANSIGIFPISNCTICRDIPGLNSQPSKDTWTVTPGSSVISFQLEISGEQQGNDWGDPNVTVTVGDPPPPPNM